jgi:hypothetical protein
MNNTSVDPTDQQQAAASADNDFKVSLADLETASILQSLRDSSTCSPSTAEPTGSHSKTYTELEFSPNADPDLASYPVSHYWDASTM